MDMVQWCLLVFIPKLRRLGPIGAGLVAQVRLWAAMGHMSSDQKPVMLGRMPINQPV